MSRTRDARRLAPAKVAVASPGPELRPVPQAPAPAESPRRGPRALVAGLNPLLVTRLMQEGLL